MIIARSIIEQYNNSNIFVKEVGIRVKDTIIAYCESTGYLFEGRMKALESVAEKIESGRYRNWRDLDDLYACTIVVPLISEEDAVIRFLQSTFIQTRLIKRGANYKSPEVFRFDSTRFVCHLKMPHGFDVGQGSSIYNIQFEVQIKSAFEYAWSKTTHALAYKSDRVDWKRLRLAAQLKATVEQLDMLILGFDNAEDLVGEGLWPAIQDKQDIQSFFVEKVKSGLIPSEVVPKDWSRFSDNVYRILQGLQGERPGSQSSKRLKNLKISLKKVETYINEFSAERFPRSISLFQLVLGTLLPPQGFSNSEDYFVAVTDELEALFPNIAGLKDKFSVKPV